MKTGRPRIPKATIEAGVALVRAGLTREDAARAVGIGRNQLKPFCRHLPRKTTAAVPAPIIDQDTQDAVVRSWFERQYGR